MQIGVLINYVSVLIHMCFFVCGKSLLRTIFGLSAGCHWSSPASAKTPHALHGELLYPTTPSATPDASVGASVRAPQVPWRHTWISFLWVCIYIVHVLIICLRIRYITGCLYYICVSWINWPCVYIYSAFIRVYVHGYTWIFTYYVCMCMYACIRMCTCTRICSYARVGV